MLSRAFHSLSPSFRLFCAASLAVLGLLFAAVPAEAQTAPTVSLSASPVSGSGVIDVTLTWSSTGAVSCAATGGWAGAKALSGTEKVTGVNKTTTFGLTCKSASGVANLTWTVPTQRTDGSALTNLAKYEIAAATTVAGLETATPVVINSGGTSYSYTGLAEGTWHFAMRAVDSAGLKSVLSNSASKAMVVQAASGSASVTVTTLPNPPVLVTVATVAWDVRVTPKGDVVLWRTVGTIPLGTPCLEHNLLSVGGLDYYDVPMAQVTYDKMPKSVVVAACAAS